ncbi:RNA dependent RNA polymerase-domain-containing protein [Leucosporidium creatinivorum]|uniref:RNA-dependent RNA polymerase n=1 Tax=Leucosporidium creatinivorum TaxID=106004 RepID=A0A1Y2FZV6_9BASI|nr:RNA dependent RNA polymerase-domain-containing protein [Leucosporidium creatinivorum]
MLAAKLAWIAEDQVRQNVSFKLSSEQCRTALVVADHLGVLKEGEIFYQASEPIVHQRRTSHVVLGDVLITRPPAVQPCDVQKMRAVFCAEYASVTDLIVMSSFGERPACSILSGGDYDGDKLLLLTDPAIVSVFDPSKADPKFADPPFADEDWFEVDKRRVATTITPLIETKDSGAIAQQLISGFYQDVKYGMLSKLHTKLAFTLGLQHPDTSTCGHLFARALDGRKQGLKLEAKWPDVQARFRASDPLPEWTYLEDGKINAELGTTKFAKRGKGLGRHVMDELVAEGRSALKRAKVTYHSRFEGWIATVDDHIASLWRSAWETACERQQQSEGDDPLYADLLRILRHVQVSRLRLLAKREGLADVSSHYSPSSLTTRLCGPPGFARGSAERRRRRDFKRPVRHPNRPQNGREARPPSRRRISSPSPKSSGAF